MTRSLLIALFFLTLTACNGSGGGPSDTTVPGSNNTQADSVDFDPTAATLDAPPLDGKLPAELLPPI